jgi:hypothetical protein
MTGLVIFAVFVGLVVWATWDVWHQLDVMDEEWVGEMDPRREWRLP